jgi:hypothetical protein
MTRVRHRPSIAVATLACAIVLSVVAVAAQGPRDRGDFPPPPLGAGFMPGIDIVGVEPLELSEPVVGVPFSADTMTTMTQQLADGNRIDQRTTGSIARDRRGRIRIEQTLTGFGPPVGGEAVRLVTITDPATREQYQLDASLRIARRLRLPPPRRDGPGGRPPFAPPQSMKTEVLEPRTFDGVKADGTRAVLVIPAGAIGNDRPIEIVSERWYSPELRVVVATRRVDPRFGNTSYRLVNIMRGDPASQLFEVPADFTLRDQPLFPPPPGAR